MKQTHVDEAETIVKDLAASLTLPGPEECLACYLDRVLHDASCDGTLRWSTLYRDRRAPRATALPRQLADRGGYCDCEVLLNVYWARSDDVVSCRGVGRGSTKPCALWHGRRRGEPWY